MDTQLDLIEKIVTCFLAGVLYWFMVMGFTAEFRISRRYRKHVYGIMFVILCAISAAVASNANNMLDASLCLLTPLSALLYWRHRLRMRRKRYELLHPSH